MKWTPGLRQRNRLIREQLTYCSKFSCSPPGSPRPSALEQACRNKSADLHPRRKLPLDDFRAGSVVRKTRDDHAGETTHAGKISAKRIRKSRSNWGRCR
jgi:hypothetical protein